MDRPGNRYGHRYSGLSFLTYFKSQEIEGKVCNVFHKITGQTEDLLDEAKEKVADTGKVVVDKVADKVQDGADAVKDALKDAKKDVKQGAEKAKTEIKEGYEDVKKEASKKLD
jgi:gas vesicle protein